MADTWRVRVQYAHGDDFTRQQMSEVEVEARNRGEARLVGEQMAMTPHPGKPEHLQITRTEVLRHHVCNADPSKGQVCSHLVTDEQLGAMGNPVRKIEKGPFGTPIVTQEGIPHEKAVMKSWGEGHVRLCNKTKYLDAEPVDPRNEEQFGGG